MNNSSVFDWKKNLPESRSPSPIREKISDYDKKMYGKPMTAPSGWKYPYIGKSFPTANRPIPPSITQYSGPLTRNKKRKRKDSKFPVILPAKKLSNSSGSKKKVSKKVSKKETKQITKKIR